MVSCGFVNLLQLLVQLSVQLSVNMSVQLSLQLSGQLSVQHLSVTLVLRCLAHVHPVLPSAKCPLHPTDTQSSTDYPKIPRRDSHCANLQLKLALAPSLSLPGLQMFMMRQQTFCSSSSSSSSSSYIVVL